MIRDMLVETPSVAREDGKFIVNVHWRDADALQLYLQRRGIACTACWEPEGRVAWLELPVGTDPIAVAEAITDWLN